MGSQGQLFGGSWTEDKLARVQKYLQAYVTALKNQPFGTVYVDAFAGTGAVKTKGGVPSCDGIPLAELAEKETRDYVVGSTKLALEVSPPFSKYVFIEKAKTAVGELQDLADSSPLCGRIEIVRGDANMSVRRLCEAGDWFANRAVLFLDPFGMQVDWRTIECVAGTRAIDMWYLFPLGAAMRLLTRDRGPSPTMAARLDGLFGSDDWREAFYAVSEQARLFGDDVCIERTASFGALADYTLGRLRSVFTGVSDRGLVLCNSKNVPLYLLCFAVGNEKGKPIALRIANHILKD
jgi:three-Cys-motif partner protein